MTGMMTTTIITTTIHPRHRSIIIPSPRITTASLRHITTVSLRLSHTITASLRPSLTAMASLLRDRTVRTDTVSFT